MTLWQVIGLLVRQLPFTKEKLEKALGITLMEESRNEYFTHWRGGCCVLGDDLTITSINLSARNDGKPHADGISIELEGACISLEQTDILLEQFATAQQARGSHP